MTKKSQQSVLRRAARPGEGAAIEVSTHRSPNAEGTTLSFDLTQAPVPDRRYVSGRVAVVRDPEEVLLCFGQKKVGSSELRSLLEIHVSFEGIHRFLRSVDEFEPTARDFVRRAGVLVPEPLDLAREPEQTVALTANIIGASFSGRDACLDFYHSSAFAALIVKSGGPFMIDPVVRVTLTIGQILGIIEGAKALQAELPHDELEVA